MRSVDWREKNVLEIGLGLGADSEQIIRLGAIWSGLDLTPTSVERVKTRLSLRGLPYKDLKQGSVLQIPYASGSFTPSRPCPAAAGGVESRALVSVHGVSHEIRPQSPPLDRPDARRPRARGGEGQAARLRRHRDADLRTQRAAPCPVG
ncbi:MAG: methyltransferase domain-containing protein [Planctomycetota bacterium]